MRAVSNFLRRRLSLRSIASTRSIPAQIQQLRFTGDGGQMRFVADLPITRLRRALRAHLRVVRDDDGSQRIEVDLAMALGGQTIAESPLRPPDVLADGFGDALPLPRHDRHGQPGGWSDIWGTPDALPAGLHRPRRQGRALRGLRWWCHAAAGRRRGQRGRKTPQNGEPHIAWRPAAGAVAGKRCLPRWSGGSPAPRDGNACRAACCATAWSLTRAGLEYAPVRVAANDRCLLSRPTAATIPGIFAMLTESARQTRWGIPTECRRSAARGAVPPGRRGPGDADRLPARSPTGDRDSCQIQVSAAPRTDDYAAYRPTAGATRCLREVETGADGGRPRSRSPAQRVTARRRVVRAPEVLAARPGRGRHVAHAGICQGQRRRCSRRRQP